MATGDKRPTSAAEFVPFHALLSGAGKKQVIDPEKQVKEMLAAKKAEADVLISEAQARVAAIEKEARDKGFTEGRQAGEEAGRKQYESLLADFRALLLALEGQRGTVQQQYEKDLAPLIEAIVRRLVHHEVSVNPRVIVSCLQKTMQYVSSSATVRVRLHPDDFQRVKEAGLQNPDLLAGMERIDLIEDPAVGQGGCLVKSDFGEIDAGMEAFIDRMTAAVNQAFLAALAEAGVGRAAPPPVDT